MGECRLLGSTGHGIVSGGDSKDIQITVTGTGSFIEVGVSGILVMVMVVEIVSTFSVKIHL